MRARTRGFGVALVGVLILAAGCKPEITTDTYFCGPEMLCPPKLSCHLGPTQSDDEREPALFAYSCVTSLAAGPFACSEITSDQEPDNEPEAALDLMTLACGSQIAQANWGCIDVARDVDHYQFTQADVCSGNNPRFEANLRYPIGTAPLAIDLLDPSGAVVSSGAVCTEASDEGGIEERCISVPNLPVGEYVLRVQIDADGNADCDGSCAFNRYQVSVSSPIS